MPLDPEKLAALAPTDLPCDYGTDYSNLYALSTGFAADPMNLRELPYAVDTMGGSTVPTMATTLAYPYYLEKCGWDFSQMLHSEQKLELYRPLPVSAELLLNARVAKVLDFGAWISFTGVVTFPSAPEVAEAARIVPVRA